MLNCKLTVSIAFVLGSRILASPGDPIDCLKTKILTLDPDQNPGGSVVKLSLTNTCQKDITAYDVWFHDASSQKSFYLGEERLASLASGSSEGIFRPGMSWELIGAIPFPFQTESAEALIFSDGTVMGVPAKIANLVKGRQEAMAKLKADLDILDSFQDVSIAAVTLQQKADEESASHPNLNTYVQQLAKKFSISSASAWNLYVKSEQQRLQQCIDLFNKHLLLTASSRQAE